MGVRKPQNNGQPVYNGLTTQPVKEIKEVFGANNVGNRTTSFGGTVQKIQLEKKQEVKKVELNNLPPRVTLFNATEVDTKNKMSLEDLSRNLMKVWQITQQSNHLGYYVCALKKIGVINYDYKSLAKIINRLYKVCRVEKTISDKTLAMYTKNLNQNKVSMYQPFSAIVTTRTNTNAISDTDLDAMFNDFIITD